MGMFEKIKNLFYDEEVIEVPREKLKDEVKNNNNSSVEALEEPKNEMDTVISERDLIKKETNFKFPVIFEDEDFAEPKKVSKPVRERSTYSRVEEQKIKYKKPTLDREVIKEVIEKPKKFKPSPVISPVYGILDKNYKKDDDEKSGKHSLEQTKELVINFDTIRQKAYGTLSDDIERELAPKEDKIDEIEKEIDNILVENNLLTDLEDDEATIDSSLTTVVDDSDEYNYSDFGVEYKISEDGDLAKDKKDENITKKDKDTKKDVKEELKDKDKKENEDEDKQLELTEDLFNLIDSMYDR